MDDEKRRKAKSKKKVKLKTSDANKSTDFSWLLKTLIITFVLSAVFNLASSEVMQRVNMWAAIVILLIIIFIGIISDIIGVAVTTAEETPFHSMAVHNVKGSRQAIKLIKSRDKVSNFCNDVIGDICGIISGSAAAAVVGYVILAFDSINNLLVSLAITSVVAALTVGGKAIGKGIAMSQSNRIVYCVARVLAVFDFVGVKNKRQDRNKSKCR